jgi:hypothetical protein
MKFSLNAQLGILSASVLTLAVVVTVPVICQKTATNPEFPTERLLANIPDGCVVINQTRVSPSIFNPELRGTHDTVVTVQCIE